MKSTYLRWGAFLFALFHIYCNVFASISELWLSAIHFGGFCAICALMANESAPVTRKSAKYWINIVFAVLAVMTTAYLLLFENALYARETEYILSDYVFSIIAVLLAMEFTRRTTGWFMPVLIMVSLSYILFLGRYISGMFAFPGLSLETVLYRSYFTSEGMFGMTADISSTFVFMFIIFGSFLLRSGAGDFIVRLARCLAGRYTGGAGLVAVVGSGLMGSVSGSAVANTMSTGVITVPMMRQSGFNAQFSAGAIAAAATGGALMPPVMGAGAFVMASYTQISYLAIIAVSTLPAILYYLTVCYFVRIEALRLGIAPQSVGDSEKVSAVLKQGWHFLIPMIVLVGFLVAGRTPTSAAAFAILAIIATSWISSNPMGPKDVFDAMVDGVQSMVSTALLLVAVGLIINVVNTTGIGNAFSLMIVDWAQGDLLTTLILIALASLVLGMGLPVTAAYIVLATLSAPMLYDLLSQSALLEALEAGDLPSNVAATIGLFGGDALTALQQMPLEMKQLIREEMLDPALLTSMLLSSHLIIFWLSQDSNVTPPVCLAAFTAAGIAGTPPMATGMTSWKLAKGLYLVPLLFAYSPLITGSWLERIEIFVYACFGLYALAGVLQWHLEDKLSVITASLLVIGAGLLMWMELSFIYHLAGLAIIAGVVYKQNRDRKLRTTIPT